MKPFSSLRPLLRPTGSLRTQLILWNVVALSLSLGGLGIVCRLVTLSFMMRSVDKELERGVEMYRRPPPPDAAPFDRELPPPAGPNPFWNGRVPPREPRDPRYSLRPHLFTADGQSAFPDDHRSVWDADALARALRGEPVYSTVTLEGEPVRILSAPGFTPYHTPGAVQNAYSLKEVYRAIAGVDTALLLMIPIALLGAGWMGSALTNRILRRMGQMTRAAARIQANDFAQRLPVTGTDEFSEMAATFNALLARREEAFEEQQRSLELQRRFTADASHELKTPLTIIKGCASLALSRASTDHVAQNTFREIDTAADTMAQLVQDLLLLARSDCGQMGRDPIEMLVREILERAKAQTWRAGCAPIALNIVPEDLAITGNESELVRLFRNLLENAVRYTPPEGAIEVTATASPEAVAITIKDTGPGIAPEHLPHLGERFYRVDTSRSRPDGGTGLGLSICKGIVEAHRGALSIESAPGRGTTVRTVIPVHNDDRHRPCRGCE